MHTAHRPWRSTHRFFTLFLLDIVAAAVSLFHSKWNFSDNSLDRDKIFVGARVLNCVH